MAEDMRFNVAKFMENVVWTPTWISNGHFAAKKEFVKLGTHLTSDDAVICAYPKSKVVTAWEDEKIADALNVKAVRVQFTRSPWRHRNAALFLDDNGNAAWFDADYCDALRIETLYGPSAMFATKKADERYSPYYNAPTFDEATVVIMPMTVPVDWDQVARTVAAATSVEEATPERFADMPEPEPEATPGTEREGEGPQIPLGTAIVNTMIEQAADPNSKVAKVLRPKKGSGIDSVTLSSGGKSATLHAKDTN